MPKRISENKPGGNCFPSGLDSFWVWTDVLLCLCGLHVDELASFLAFGEHYHSVNKSEEGVILAHAYVETGVVHCATLTLEDVAGFAILSAENLHTESFAF